VQAEAQLGGDHGLGRSPCQSDTGLPDVNADAYGGERFVFVEKKKDP